MKVIQKHIINLFMLSVSLISNAQDSNADLVKKIRSVIDSAYFNFGYDSRLQNKASAAYDSLFTQLADQIKQNPLSSANETTLDRKILAIASHKAKHNELFTEIANKYIFGVDNPKHIAPSSPELMAVHTTTPYRLVWEYFLLKPPATNMSNHYDITITDAIATINNPASLLAIHKWYETSTRTKIGLDQSIILKQKLSLLTIGRMPSEAAIKTLITMINLPVQRDSTRIFNWQPKEFVKDMLGGKEHLKTEDQWKTDARSLERKQIDAATKKQLKDLRLID